MDEIPAGLFELSDADLADALSAAFPHGYLVALPDRSCGLAVSAEANTAERREFDAMVENCFSGATTPMSDQIMAPEALCLHAS